ncbi:MAG: citramalate synthase [Candidatus Tectomicrobia bacterium]|uniref:Citramalate synthase n=1 Tax=Tectimicrobiota bacterium TaxID=2528274 RepID=A0A932FU76_UNCTE|nr:citramalate synthase [Candidatus Tectomicrobia bacterium]
MKEIQIYDTTLRDGSQSEEISFSLEDKLRIAQKLDELGIRYIEGGWPGSNPKDIQFFQEIKKIPLTHAKIAAFGSTRRAQVRVEEDANVRALLEAQTEVATVVGKTWDLHVKDALQISLEENLELIYDTLHYLKERIPEVFFDAEHFFDGFKRNREYALRCLEAAQAGGVDCIVLCDTNGGTLAPEIPEVFAEVKQRILTPLGIHTHNDSEMAVANTIMAVKHGAVHVQGTINGYGERCGNANLCSIIPNLQLKMKLHCISDPQMRRLREVSAFVNELANLKPWSRQPYVGKSAFAHKGGIHVNAILKNPETYEHIRPEWVGNDQRVLISELSGRGNIVYKAKELDIGLREKDPATQEILQAIKELENQGYQFEGAEGSLNLLMRECLGERRKFFDLKGFRVIVEKRKEGEEPICEATIMLTVDGAVEHTAAEGNGPVNALDNALRKALEKFYPILREMELLDYKVRILDESQGTGARIRVLIESGDGKTKWGTVGVSQNIIEASWQALVDSIEYKLNRDVASNASSRPAIKRARQRVQSGI